MSGIVFFSTEQREAVVDFYIERVGATVWLEQPDCTILDYDGFRFGFCERATTDDCGTLTFVYDDKAGVDEAHEAVGDAATEQPHENETYEIYQFFAEDPDGRTAEFQTFLHDLPES
ncbi:VOC family protein [Halovenus salina]|uniref:VOC family protein n=1 Tax=Halovenus salina TaxID=1510225 RepID=A0ABD5VYU4_9EURY|nr:VOC family protein [Halovenus salina]